MGVKHIRLSFFGVLLLLLFFGFNAYSGQYGTPTYSVASSSLYKNASLTFSACTTQQHSPRARFRKISYAFNDARIDISRMSEQQLRAYFRTCNATHAQILHNAVWFMSDAFIAIVHTFPEYEEALTHHAATITALTFFNTCARWFNNQYCVGLKKRIRTLLDQHIQKQLAAAGYSPAYQQTLEALQQNLDVTKDIYTSALYEQRRAALAQTLAKPHAQSTCRYSVPPLRSDEIHSEQLTTFTGNHYEHQVHTEFLTQLEELGHIIPRDNAVTRMLYTALAHGIQSNRDHKTKTATTWADYGWKALAITRSMFEGVGEGAVRTAQAFINPVQTLQNIASGLQALATLTETTLQTIRSFENAFFSGNLTQCATLARTLGSYTQDHATALITSLINTPPEHTAREATATLTEFLLSHKLWNTLATYVPKKLAQAQSVIDQEFSRLQNMPLAQPAIAAVEASYEVAPALTRTTALLMEESDTAAAAAKKAAQKAAKKIAVGATAATTGPKIAEKITRLLIPAPCDTAALEKMFESYCFVEVKPVHIDAEHPFAFYERIAVKRSGHMKAPAQYGGHHDYGRRLEKAGKIKYQNVVEGPVGSFKAETIINDIRYPAKTYFPPEWNEQKVIEKIFEAFQDLERTIEIDGQGHYKIIGKTSEGLKIKIIFDPYHSKITTAYPIVKEIVCF